MMHIAWLRIVVVVVALGSAPAYAHNLGGRYGPLLHPLLSLDHLLALVAIGLLAGQQGARGARRLIVALLLGLLLGAVLPIFANLADLVSHLDLVNAASLFVLGGLVALAARIPHSLLLIVVAFFGMSHGAANAIDLAGTAAPALIVVGVAVAGMIATLPLAIVITTLGQGWPRIVVRVIGSWIAAIGLMMLGLALKPLLA